jgi:microcystin-dependent protein
MASIINAGTTTATALNMITDTTGAMAIQTSGTTAISISSSQVVALTNPLAVTSGGTGVTTSTGSGSVVLGTSPILTSPDLRGTPIAPTATVGTNTTQIATTAFVLANGVPSGVILLWSGSVASIPTGWLLCNGSSGTPDLRNRFIVGAGSTYNPGNTGGSADATLVSHNHTATSVVTDPTHNHQTQGYADNSGSGVGALRTSIGGNLSLINTTAVATGVTVATTVANAGSSATNANLPPYYALAYIMKS